jgi:hypothetical protein
MELVGLLQQELTNIEMAQSYLLTLWKKMQVVRPSSQLRLDFSFVPTR